MIRPLRKRHRLIWIVLSVIIPILFIKSYRSTSAFPKENADISTDPLVFVESKTAKSDHYSAMVGTLKSGEKVLQLELKALFRSPAPGVYLVPENKDNVADYRLLGEVNKIGSYQFEFKVADDNYQLTVYDPIKRINLETFNFQ